MGDGHGHTQRTPGRYSWAVTKVAECARWLRVLLPESDDWLPATVATESCRRKHFGMKTMRRGMEEAGVLPELIGFGGDARWWWHREPRLAASLTGPRRRGRHAQSVRPCDWRPPELGDEIVWVRCPECHHESQTDSWRLPAVCWTPTCAGILRRVLVPTPLAIEPVPPPDPGICRSRRPGP
jgi:hypothetical protein